MKPIVDVASGEVTIVDRDPAEEQEWINAHREFVPTSQMIAELRAEVDRVKVDRTDAQNVRAKIGTLQATVNSMTALMNAWSEARSPQAKDAILQTNFGDLLAAQASIAQALIDLTQATVKEQ